MMRIVIILLSCLSVLFSSCAGSNVTAREKSTKMQQSFVFSGDGSADIDCIKINYPCEVYYTVLPSGSSPKLTYSFNEEESGAFKIFCQKGELRIEFDKRMNLKKTSLKVYLSTPPVERIEMSSAASMQVKGDYTSSKSLNVDINAAADLNFNDIELTNDARFKLISSGAASIEMGNLKCNTASIGLSGASGFYCVSLDIPILTVDCSGASDMNIRVNSENLMLVCSGASSISVKGEAVKAVLSATGVSKIRAKGLVAQSYNISESGKSSVSGIARKQKNRNSGDETLEIPAGGDKVPIP